MIFWNNLLWTHNDSDDINIYALDTLNRNIVQSHALTGTQNKDWEEISQDENYIYIGDFGNNSAGNRTDLKILRIQKNSLLSGKSPQIDTINFYYSDQTDFVASEANNTDFDCEAFIISKDSIFLFTKQWKRNGTSVYSLPKNPGSYPAEKRTSYNVGGLITGATWLPSKQLIVLCGYSNLLQPFIYLLYDFDYYNFFGGNKRKVSVSLPFHQIEGITTNNGVKYYMTNEFFSLPPYVTIQQQLHVFDLSAFLRGYLDSSSTDTTKAGENDIYSVYPVPAKHSVVIKRNNFQQPEEYFVISNTGKILKTGLLTEEEDQIDVSFLSQGFYIFRIGNKAAHHLKMIKQ